MNRLLILLFAAILWTLASVIVAEEKHDQKTDQKVLQEKDNHEGHDHSEHEGTIYDESGQDDNQDHEIDSTHEGCEGHDHSENGETEATHDDEAQDSHEGHDHSASEGTVHEEGETQDSHAGHDHEEEGIIEISEEAMKMAGIEVAEVTQGRIKCFIDLPGEVGFNEDRLAHIVPRFAGITKEIHYRIGDYVKAGDVVAVVESNESMSSYSIEAPISGWIIEKHVTPGEFVSEESSIYVIADLTTVWVNLAVYPQDAEYIRPGQKALVEAIGSKSKAEGTIQYVTPILDLNTRSITARVILTNPNNMWRPGTFVHARIENGAGEDGLIVEKDAVQYLDNEQVVFVTEGEGRFKPVEVVTGECDARFIQILSGIDKGIEYVVSGAFELKAKLVTSSLGGHAGHGH